MGGNNVDFKDLENLQKKLKDLSGNKMDVFFDSCIKEIAARLLAKVIKRTPVGKKPFFDGPKTAKVKGANGKSKSFLTKKGAILQKYWDGYSGGTLRRGWTAKTESEAKSGKGKSAVDVNGYLRGMATFRSGNIISIDIINPVSWASYVEKGHRQRPGRYVPQIGKRLKKGWVRGRFMLTISEREIQAQAPKIIKKKLELFLGDVFNDK